METSQPGPPQAVVDLGSGAGVPGLMLAARWENSRFLLVDAQGRRAAFLLRAVRELGFDDRVAVVAERAEVLGRTPAKRGAFDLVTARGFGCPAVVAECAAPFLSVTGLLVVSEPPPDLNADQQSRWSTQGLAQLGMGPPRPMGTDYRFVVMRQLEACPERLPRRVGVPAKRPLF